MIKIVDPQLSPSIAVKAALIDGDGSMCLYGDNIPELVFNHAFFWMIETWIKNNQLLYQVDRNQLPHSTSTGIRIFGHELDEMEYFINNL